MNTTYRKYILVLGGILLVSIVAYAFTTKNKSQISANHPTSPRVKSALQNPALKNYYADLIPYLQAKMQTEEKPIQFDVAQYTLQTPLPSPKPATDIYIYTLKTNYTKSEADDIARRILNTSEFESFEESPASYTYNAKNSSLYFNRENGSFSMLSGDIAVAPPNTTDKETLGQLVTTYLEKNGLIDDTVKLTAYYVVKNEPLIYFEYHRDWDAVGLPILNPVGILTVPENVSLQDLSLTTFFPTDTKDDTITQASDASGYQRRNEFNTLTVAIKPSSGKLYSLESNIRQIVKKSTLAENNLSLLDPQKIEEELQKDGAYFSATIPTGEGTIDQKKVYPDNMLSTEKADITDVVLAYFEKNPSVQQTYLQPSYFIRGTTTTDTGIRVKFSHLVPAVETTQ